MNLLPKLLSQNSWCKDYCYHLMLSSCYTEAGIVYTTYETSDFSEEVIEALVEEGVIVLEDSYISVAAFRNGRQVLHSLKDPKILLDKVHPHFVLAAPYPTLEAKRRLKEIESVLLEPDVSPKSLVKLWENLFVIVCQEVPRQAMAKEMGQAKTFLRLYPPETVKAMLVEYLTRSEAYSPKHSPSLGHFLVIKDLVHKAVMGHKKSDSRRSGKNVSNEDTY